MGSPCDTDIRTLSVTCFNATETWTIDEAYVHLRSNLDREPYIKDAGQVEAGKNIGPGKENTFDPCVLVGQPICTTEYDFKLLVSNRSGQKQTIAQTVTAKPGGFLDVVKFGFKPAPVKTKASDGTVGWSADVNEVEVEAFSEP